MNMSSVRAMSAMRLMCSRSRPARRGRVGSTAALLALARAEAILLWDPSNRTLIAANLIGTWLEETPTGVARAADWVVEPRT